MMERQAPELLEQHDIAREQIGDLVDSRRCEPIKRDQCSTHPAAESNHVAPMKCLDRRVIAVRDHQVAILEHRRSQVGPLATPVTHLDSCPAVAIDLRQRTRKFSEKYRLGRRSLDRTRAPAISAIAISWIPAPATFPATMNPTVFGRLTFEVRRAAVPAINFNASLLNGFSNASIEFSSIATEYPAESAIAAIASRRRA